MFDHSTFFRGLDSPFRFANVIMGILVFALICQSLAPPRVSHSFNVLNHAYTYISIQTFSRYENTNCTFYKQQNCLVFDKQVIDH